jgi:EmrB/QacA subfamily drug resistance transporter
VTAEEHAYQRRWLILGVLCFSLLVIVLDNSILNVAIPTIIDDLGATNTQLQWIIDSYTLVFAGLLLTAGSLGDRYGRRGALQVGFVIFGLGSLLSSQATTANQLIATRAFMGIGGALIMPATLSIITNVFPKEERGKAIGVWAGVAGLGAALGPLTGGFLLEHFYWGSVFVVNLPIVVIGLVAGFVLIPTSKDPSVPKLDPLGAALSIVSLSALLYGLIEAPAKGWGSTEILVAIGLGVAGLIGFIVWERRIDHPMLDVTFFKNPRFSAASGSITLVFFAMFGSMFLLTQYLQFVLGYTPLETGIRLLPFAGTMMVVAPLSSKVVQAINTKRTVALGLTMVTVALLLMTRVQVDSSYLSIVWRLMLMSAGMGLTMAPATDSVMGSLPLAKAGVGSAVNDTTRQVGGALGVAVIGSVLSSVYGTRIADFFAGTPAPPEVVEVAKSSLGGAMRVASTIGGAQGAELLRVANQGFVDSFHTGAKVAAVATFLGVIVALVFLPAHARDADVAEQDLEYAEEHLHDVGIPLDDIAPALAHDGPVAAGQGGAPQGATGGGRPPVGQPLPQVTDDGR